MKFLFGIFCCFGLMLSSVLPIDAAPMDPVTIPDANLRAAIETKLGKSSGATITEAEMNGMTGQLSAGSKNIRSLTGLEHATGMGSLQLSRNKISDLSPLSGLTQLTSLDLDLNLMTDLSALSNLTNLTLLYAGRPLTQANYNGPTPADLSFLTKLTKLEYLKLNVWAIRDLSILGTLTALKELYLQYNHFSDISPLSSLTALTKLDLTFNYFLTDISPLGSLTALDGLHLTSNSQISDISALKNLTNLELLWLHSTNITTEGLAEVLPSFSSLTYLILDGTRISDLSVLDRLPAGASMENLSVRHIHDPPGAQDDRGWLLKDLTPLVELMESGKLVNQDSQSRIEVRLNWNLDYDSIYTDIPALITDFSMPGVVAYSPVVPGLRRGSEEQEHHVGNPQSRHTFRVSAYSTFEDYRAAWPGNRYTAEKVNEEFEGVPVTWKVTAPDGTVTETEEPVRTGADGLSSFTFTLGNDGETHTVEAIVPENTRAEAAGPSHDELKVAFTATAVAPPVITLTLDDVGYTHIQWIADVSGTLPQAYAYYFKKSAESAWMEHADLGRLPRRFSFVHLDLEPGTSYDFQLFALRGESQIEPGSNVLTASTLSRTPPGPRPPDPPPDPPAPVNHPPVFRSASAVNVAENTTAVITIIAEDPDAEDEITGYAITGGADAALFEIGGASTPADMLRFKTAPDFEMPGSAANSNVYTLILTATSGVGDRELTATQTLIVTVTDVDEPIVPPVRPPVDPPVEPESPVDPPVEPPVEPPVDPPVEPPVEPPIEPPVQPPVEPPVEQPTPIDYPPSLRPPIPLETQSLIFNEIGNLWDDTNDWIELKNVCNTPLDLSEWQIRLITTEKVESGAEIDIVSLPGFVLPAQGVLLVANTDPSENHLASGLNIATGARESGAQHLYFVAKRLKLPDTPFLLILQRTTWADKASTIADVAGNYFWEVLSDGPEVYPFFEAAYSTEETAPLTQFGAWQRQRLEQPGYLAAAWVPSGYHAYLGYDRHAPAWTCLGTPGYRLDPSPSQPVAHRLVFNEIRNASDDTNDWIELKNVCGEGVRLRDWEISIVTSEGKYTNQDADIISFPDYTLSMGGVLLITNTDPSQTVVAGGLNIATGAKQKGAQHLYFVASDLKLPSTPYLLILRHVQEKDGDFVRTIEDVVGNYLWPVLYDVTEVYPHSYKPNPTEATAPLAQFGAWQRQHLEQPGYLAAAWIPSGYHAHLGYDRHAPASMCLGTPGYLRDSSPVLPLVSHVVFNKIRNASDDTNDYIELKNVCDMDVRLRDWEISIVTSTGEYVDQDVDIVSFPDYILPTQGLLLITSTDPSETWLASGLDIAASEQETDARYPYFVAPDLKLPDTPFLLILRHAREKNSTPESIEDVAGSYFRNTVDNNMGVWPLADTHRPSVPVAELNWVGVWQRKDIRERGYLATAWTEIQSPPGIGSAPNALDDGENALFVPNANAAAVVFNPTLPDEVRITELMYDFSGASPQWIELYNASQTPVDLKGWQLGVETRTDRTHRHATLTLKTLVLPPKQTGLLVTGQGERSDALPTERVYDLSEVHRDTFRRHLKNTIFGTEGFSLKLLHPTGRVVDRVGNLDGNKDTKNDQPTWTLPNSMTPQGHRFSLLRRFDGDVLKGTKASGWMSAVSVAIGINAYYGHPTDISTPLFLHQIVPGTSPTVALSISEIMFETKTRSRTLPQWIELYNPSFTDSVKLLGYQLIVETRQEGEHQQIVMTLEAFDVLPNQTALLITARGVHSKHLPDNHTYNLFQRHPKAFSPMPNRFRLISSDGFLVQLTDDTGNVVDTVGNLDGYPHTKDIPAWTLPSGETNDGERASIRRLYKKRLPLDGRQVTAWVSTATVPPKIITYYGDATDVGNPGYRKGTPLPVTLSSFTAEHTPDGVVINWTTESEVDNAGFYIYRSQTKAGKFQRVNTKLIQGTGTTGERTEYTWMDTTAKPNTVYYYQIEDVSYAGVHKTLTTTRLRGLISAKGKMITQWADLK